MHFYDHIKTDEIRFPQIISRILIQKADYISPLGNTHGLRTPNEGINQRYLEIWADVADKICCRHT